MALTVGTRAPQFTLKSKTAEGLVDVSLVDYEGDNVVLAFFPAAFTGVCTQEFCDLSVGLGELEQLSTKVFGISCDTAFAQAAWAAQEKISVTLLSDYAHEVTLAYDVVLPDLAGLGPACQRAVFVIDGDGVIQYVEVTPTPGDLPDFEALKAVVARLQGSVIA